MGDVTKVDDHTLIKGAIDGMLNALDPHSSYAEQADFEDLNTISTGNYGGIGVLTTVEDGAMKVISTTEDSPAWRAGIKSGDYITRVEGKLVYGLNLDEGNERLRGTPGSPVKLSIFRRGRQKPIDMTIVRAVMT
jgi:carboxyl-terminal processing protease